ncbi:hypothetical protein, partial [Paenibacillus macerans]|uniref:hypothetical protein n=1 Tax=Paenibacillus macerans TaxID=44252 RepID=UPI0039F06EA7
AEEFAFSLPGALLTFWNRRMRTRMYGGVRGRGLVTLSYSIFGMLQRDEMDRVLSYTADSERIFPTFFKTQLFESILLPTYCPSEL